MNYGFIQASDRLDGDFTELDEVNLVRLATLTCNGARRVGTAPPTRVPQEGRRTAAHVMVVPVRSRRNPKAPAASRRGTYRRGRVPVKNALGHRNQHDDRVSSPVPPWQTSAPSPPLSTHWNGDRAPGMDYGSTGQRHLKLLGNS